MGNALDRMAAKAGHTPEAETSGPVTEQSKDLSLSEVFAQQVPELARAIPAGSGLEPDRLARLALSVVRMAPKLIPIANTQYGRTSILAAVMRSAQLGLEIGPDLGESWIIPRKGMASWQLGYRGVLTLALRSGEISHVDVGHFYAGEMEAYEIGLEPKLKIVPHDPRPVLDPAAGYYAMVYRTDGRVQWKVRDAGEIQAYLAKSVPHWRSSDAWKDHYDAMAAVSVFRAMRNWLPLTAETRKALRDDDQILDLTPEDDGVARWISQAKQTPEPAAAQEPATEEEEVPVEAETQPVQDIPEGEPFGDVSAPAPEPEPETAPADSTEPAPEPEGWLPARLVAAAGPLKADNLRGWLDAQETEYPKGASKRQLLAIATGHLNTEPEAAAKVVQQWLAAQ